MPHKLIELIRVLPEPKNFDVTRHGPGYYLIHDAGIKHGDEKARVHADRVPLSRRLAGLSSDFTHYFVKRLPKDLELTGWRFRWAEASTRMDLELEAGIDLHVTDIEQARALVALLHAPEGPEKALHALIDSTLHTELRERARNDANLLDTILPKSRQASSGVNLNQAVSEAIQRRLGGASFSIGFSVESHPPRSLDIDEHSTRFKTSDTPPNEQQVKTTAQIELKNYQDFKQSGLKSQLDLERAVKEIIDEAVKRHLFGKGYYAVAASFHNATADTPAIRTQIKTEITEKVGEWGYGVRLFHSVPDIAALDLVRGVRVDILNQEFRTQRSIGVVKMDVSVLVTARHFQRVAELIPPNDAKDAEVIRKKLFDLLLQTCRDEVLRIDRRRFNLEFDAAPEGISSVVDQLTESFRKALDQRYGLRVDVINIVQQATEDAERFNALRGAGAVPFKLTLSSRGNAGSRDAVQIDGEFEILSMHKEGWEKFEGKDYGFRRSSTFWNASQWEAFRKGDEDRERKAQAVRNELAAISARVTSLLTGPLKSLRDLAVRSREYQNLLNLEGVATTLMTKKIEDEFGLVIKLRKFERQDTATELLNGRIRSVQQEANEKRAVADAQHAIDMAATDRAHRQGRKQLLLDRLSDLSDRDPNDPSRKSEEAAIQAELDKLGEGADWGTVSGESLSNVLKDDEPEKPSIGLLGDELSPTHRRALK